MSEYCTTCGASDSLKQGYDNHCCGECGDTEGIIHLEDYQDEAYDLIENNLIVTKEELREYRL